MAKWMAIEHVNSFNRIIKLNLIKKIEGHIHKLCKQLCKKLPMSIPTMLMTAWAKELLASASFSELSTLAPSAAVIFVSSKLMWSQLHCLLSSKQILQFVHCTGNRAKFWPCTDTVPSTWLLCWTQFDWRLRLFPKDFNILPPILINSQQIKGEIIDKKKTRKN